MYNLDEISFDSAQGYVCVLGRERIQMVANRLGYPSFLLEAASIENRNCRRFALNKKTGRVVLIIDFDLLSNEILADISKLPRWASIPGFILFDHIHPSDLGSRFIRSIAGSPTSVLPPECIPDGKASDNAFPSYFNDINIVDPFLNMSDRFLIYDEGNLYQWKFADIGKSTVRANHSAYFSNDVDLTNFEKITYEFLDILNDNKQDIETLLALYEKLSDERHSVINKLSEIYIVRKLANQDRPNYNNKPPRLGRFDRLQLTDEGYRVSTDVAPLLYHAALNHLAAALKIKPGPVYNDTVILETIPGILMAYLCLDSHTNDLGNNLRLPNWESSVVSSLESKIGTITKNRGNSNLLKDRPDIKRSIKNMTTLRNDLIHYKHNFHSPVSIEQEEVSEIYTRIGLDSLKNIIKEVRMVIKLIYSHINLPFPLWLGKRPGWLDDDNNPMHLVP